MLQQKVKGYTCSISHHSHTAENNLATSVIKHNNITSIKTISDSAYISFDDLRKYGNGLFSIRVSDNNTPDGSSGSYWYVLQICFYTSNQFAVQIATDSDGNKSILYMRKATGANTWSAWKKVILT